MFELKCLNLRQNVYIQDEDTKTHIFTENVISIHLDCCRTPEHLLNNFHTLEISNILIKDN